MRDITNLMLEFKEAVRHSWNMYFAKSDSPMSPEIQNAFEHVELGLFQAIVLTPMGALDRTDLYRKQPLPFILAKPHKVHRELPLQVGMRDENGNTSWATSITVSVDSQSSFEFFEFFDWYPYGYIDLPYVKARVASLESKPSLEGSMVLIEQVYCCFSFIE